MKKTVLRMLAMLLAALCVAGLAACGQSGETTETVQQTKPQGLVEDLASNIDAAEIKDQLTWEKLNSFPIKWEGMSIDEARALCVDYFNFYKAALWTPSVDVEFVRNKSESNDVMEKGNIYGGLPYIGLGSGTLYRLMDYMDEETGVVDMHRALKRESFDTPVTMDEMKYFGNQCANGAFGGWGRVINTISSIATTNFTHSKGCLRLGDYTYDQDKWTADARTTAVLEANGEQTIFESYALMQPADGLVYYTTAGHAAMCISDAVVVRNSNGTINGDESYIYVTDQAQNWVAATNEAGDSYEYKNNWNVKKSFTALFEGNYLPFTFAEFLGTDPIEATEVGFSLSGGKITKSQYFSATVTSNYAVSDVYAIVTNDAGEEIYRHVTRSTGSGYQSLDIVESGVRTDQWGTLPEGTWNIEVVAQLGTGERPTVYVGKIVV